MSDSICRPTAEELSTALWVCSYAKAVCISIIETGFPKGQDFMQLCEALIDLEGKMVGCREFHERAEDLHSAINSGNWEKAEDD